MVPSFICPMRVEVCGCEVRVRSEEGEGRGVV